MLRRYSALCLFQSFKKFQSFQSFGFADMDNPKH